MKKVFIYLVVCLFLMTACAPKMPTEPPSLIIEQPSDSNPTPKPTELPVDLTPAQSAALSLLSGTLNLPAEQIALVSTEAVTWPNGCLGVQKMGVMCTQALVEGYRIIFEANDKEYEIHTNDNGSSVVIASDLESNELIAAVLVKQLAENLGMNAESISVVSNEPVEFIDSCLGVAMEYVMCAEIITPGRIVVLEADGMQYEYHVSDDGRIIQPATLALTWKREGGIAGFCDSMTVFLSGEVYGSQCKTQDGRMGTLANLLTTADRKQFTSWLAEYGQVNIDVSDPKGVSDRMLVTLTFAGYGNGQTILEADQSKMLEFTQTLYQGLYK